VVTIGFPRGYLYSLGLGRTHLGIMSHPNPFCFR